MSGISVMTDLATYPAPESSGFVDVPGGRIWYRSNGDRHRDRVPLLIVHGGPGMQHDYLLPLTELAEERRVILYDQLDCGRSDRPGDPANWTFERYLAEIEYLRQGLGLERCHLLGNSWGGSLAAVYAGAGSSGLELAAQNVIVGGVGELGEDRKGPDQKQHVRLGQSHQKPVQRDFALAGPVLPHRLAADILNQVIGGLAMLFADHLAQQPPQKADEGAVFAGVSLLDPHHSGLARNCTITLRVP